MSVDRNVRFSTHLLAVEEPRAAKRKLLRRISLLLRRSHMYLALFLTPWMLMYALSTLVFNHFERVAGFYGGEMDKFEKEKEVSYTRAFAPGTPPRAKADRILEDLHLGGNLQMDERGDDKVVFTRTSAITPRRITYIASEKKLIVEKRVFRTPGFITALHARVGYGSRYKSVKAWAAGVDLTILATLLWIASGIWMWWELKITRRWGLVFGLAGAALFAAFLVLG